MTRRTFSARVTGLAAAAAVLTPRHGRSDDEISRAAESIHQEVTIAAAPKRVYEVLTDARQFTKMTTFSPVMNAAPAQIGRSVGDSFTLFGGHIVGRQIELVPYRRIVQAWRVVDWDPGVFSIAKFELTDRGAKTAILFDHTGFPKGKAEHLAEGWRLNYWIPLAKFLA
jgi:activator of HSP90 ATPase